VGAELFLVDGQTDMAKLVKTFPDFTEPKGSLQRSPEPANGSYP